MNFDPNQYPTVFLSYDEPNADANYAHLLTLCPHAKRVHGIKGSDTAHKKVAEIADSDRVIIVDADNFVKPDFYQRTYNVCEDGGYEYAVFSFTAHNVVNGQQYGNGGIKSWPTEMLRTMRTHENSNGTMFVTDFNYLNYRQQNHVASDIHINSTPLQAWRAGFREGYKLMIDMFKVMKDFKDMDWRNFDRLWNWMHIGSDVDNGIYAIHGARFGTYKALTGLEQHYVHDFDYLTDMFHNVTERLGTRITEDANRLGMLINMITDDNRIEDVYDDERSKDYRENVKPILRCDNKKPFDIVFISYDEPNADENYTRLKLRFPRAKRIHGIKGVHEAHIAAAKLCDTDYFYVVDGDAEIKEDFNFDFHIPFFDQPKVRVWRSINPINGLVYGYGGVKLFPRTLTVRMRRKKTDMSSSICDHYIPIMTVSNYTNFNSSPFNAWRGAFRECCKLASEIIDNQISIETKERLNVWCTIGRTSQYGKYAIAGANDGMEYGLQNKHDTDKLKLINDFDWLKERYDRLYKNPI